MEKPYKLVARQNPEHKTVVRVRSVEIGGNKPIIIAGPCSIESEDQINKTAEAVKRSGAHMLRGGAFKPRSSPYSFQGMGEEGLKLLKAAGEAYGLPIVTEVMDTRNVTLVAEYADMIQIGTRNMQNFSLLKEVGIAKKPVLLKRGLSSTIEETLMAAEYILAEGNREVVICERGIRTFEPQIRNTLDISAAIYMKELTHLPVIIDPSHATGIRSLIAPMARASIAAGVDGLILEVHPDPENAKTDGPQSLTFDAFDELMRELLPISIAIKRDM
jgi:3-deoxy-7-phosphoheptulonate synthase